MMTNELGRAWARGGLTLFAPGTRGGGPMSVGGPLTRSLRPHPRHERGPQQDA